MSKLQIFNNEEFGEIRTVTINSEPWFVGKDVAAALGYKDVNHSVLDHVDEDDRINSKTQGQNDPEFGQRGTWLINESGMYALVLGSKLPNAKKFKRWVTSEILPSIRRHGAYAVETILNDPDAWIQVMMELKKERADKQRLEREAEANKPKVLFANAVETSQTAILIGDLAKLIKQNGYDIGQKRLFEKLRNDGYLIKTGESRNMPTQKSMDMGLFEVKERTIDNPDGSIRVTRTTKVTGKGQIYFINKYIGKQE